MLPGWEKTFTNTLLIVGQTIRSSLGFHDSSILLYLTFIAQKSGSVGAILTYPREST